LTELFREVAMTTMNKKKILTVLVFCLSLSLILIGYAAAQKKAPETSVLTLEGAKMAPVAFSHPTHVDKAKVDCAVCHHKDKDPKEPQACVPCHAIKDPKDNAPTAKEAFHKNCITCHKEVLTKGTPAPTKCNECHKK
jgi:hypothetical protein